MSNTSTSNTTQEWSREKIVKVISDRRSGHYITEDTRDDTLRSWKELQQSDVGITLHRNSGAMNVFNSSELKQQMKQWRKVKAVCQDYNTKELKLSDDTPVWCFVIQPSKQSDLEKVGFCPLGLAHGLMVSGYCYFVKSKDICDKVVAYLK